MLRPGGLLPLPFGVRCTLCPYLEDNCTFPDHAFTIWVKLTLIKREKKLFQVNPALSVLPQLTLGTCRLSFAVSLRHMAMAFSQCFSLLSWRMLPLGHSVLPSARLLVVELGAGEEGRLTEVSICEQEPPSVGPTGPLVLECVQQEGLLEIWEWPRQNDRGCAGIRTQEICGLKVAQRCHLGIGKCSEITEKV